MPDKGENSRNGVSWQQTKFYFSCLESKLADLERKIAGLESRLCEAGSNSKDPSGMFIYTEN